MALVLGLLTLPDAPSAQAQSRAAANPVQVQMVPVSPQEAAAEGAAQGASSQAAALITLLENDGERAKLLTQLRALADARKPAGEAAAPPPPRNAVVGAITGLLAGASAMLLTAAQSVEHLPEAAATLWERLQDPALLLQIALTVAWVVGIFLAAFVAEALLKRALRASRRTLEEKVAADRPEADATLTWDIRALMKGPWPRRIGMLLLRTLMDLLPVAAFAGAAFGLLAISPLTGVLALAMGTLINANVLVRMVLVLGRVLLAPGQGSVRLLPLEDEHAAYLFLWVRRFAITALYGYFILDAARQLGLPEGAFGFLGDLLGILIAGMAVVFILQVRPQVARFIRTDEAERGEVRLANVRDRFADVWHLAAILYVGVALTIWVLGVPGGLAFLIRATLFTAVTIAAAVAALSGVSRLVKRIFALNAEFTRAYPLLEARANRFVPVIHRIMSGVVILLSALVLLEIWGASPFSWLASPQGIDMCSRLITIALVVGGAFVAWEIFSGIIDTIRRSPAGHSTRMHTLLAFFHNAVRVVLVSVVAVVVLGELGMNVAPFLAGAGVLGLAVGFGAQTLVKDIITGVLILIEDTVSVGDTVQVGGASGVVERISIRTMHIRDIEGNVFSLPFSEVKTIKNSSKDYSAAMLDIQIDRDADVDAAMAVMRGVGEALTLQEPYATLITAPVDVLGVEQLTDSAVTIRVRFRTQPLAQYRVKREYLRRIKLALEDAGIEHPGSRHTIVLAADKKKETRLVPPIVAVEA